ncbi:MAG: hypothetical protein RMM17_00875 [Acidobacteriota bacterium]|nr:hypothetical protein [Blastocatellia bacterium]MDW8411220.1 hypothetical protein [Acidobacteriota bacterium]
MNAKVKFQLIVFILLSFLPVGVLADSPGKHFKKGKEYELNQQWDLAAEQYALALSQRPDNVEYRLHMMRALANASLMFMERGKQLMQQKDYEGAYQAFRQAYSYDNTNEMALARMREMLERLGIPIERSELPSDEIQKISARMEQFRKEALPNRKLPTYKFNYSSDTTLESIIRSIAKLARLNVVFEDSVARTVETKKVRFEVENITAPQALDILFDSQRLDYSIVAPRTIMVYPEAIANKQRYEQLYVRTFYIKNADINDARNVLQTAVGSKQIVPLKQLNALVVRDTLENLKIAEMILDGIDKTQSEIVLDINLYEVSNTVLTQLGNQLAVPAEGAKGVNLSNVGGIGQGGLRSGAAGGLFGGPVGLALALPSSALSLLQSKSNSRLIASSQVRAFENETAQINIGQRVPIQTATLPTGVVVNPSPGQPNPQPNPGFGGFGVAQFQYQDVGLNVDVQPQVFNDYVQMKVTIELSGIQAGPSSFNPIFTQRKIKGTTRIKEGETGIIANVMRLDKRNTRVGLPILSFVPLLGRVFSTPKEEDDAINIVITVTPHILRSPIQTDLDKISVGPNGTANFYGAALSLEEYVIREDEAEYQQSLRAKDTPSTPSEQQRQPQQRSDIMPVGQQPAQQPMPSSMAAQTEVRPPASSQPPVGAQTQPQHPAERSKTNNLPPQPPINVMLRVLNPQIKVGQSGLIGVLLGSSGPQITSAKLTLRYNPNVIQITAVRDGGLMSLLGNTAQMDFADDGGVLYVSLERPAGAQPVAASGQLVLVYFAGVGPGSADLNLSEIQLLGPGGQPLQTTITGGNINVEGPPPDATTGGDEDEDDEEDDEDEDE